MPTCVCHSCALMLCSSCPLLQVLAGVSGLVQLTELALSGNEDDGTQLRDEALHSSLAHLTNLQVLVSGARLLLRVHCWHAMSHPGRLASRCCPAVHVHASSMLPRASLPPAPSHHLPCPPALTHCLTHDRHLSTPTTGAAAAQGPPGHAPHSGGPQAPAPPVPERQHPRGPGAAGAAGPAA